MIISYDMTCCLPNGEGYWPKDIKNLHDVAKIVSEFYPTGQSKYTDVTP